MTKAAAGGAGRARFELLYAQTRIPILGYLLRRCGDPADAVDLLADTYLTVWRRIDDVPAGEQARPWVFGVARRTLANHRRHQQVENRLADVLRDQLRAELNRVPTHTDSVFAAAIAESLAALRASDREIIELTAYDQLTPAEIAIITGKSPGAIRVALHRARRVLRRELSREAGHADDSRTAPIDSPRR